MMLKLLFGYSVLKFWHDKFIEIGYKIANILEGEYFNTLFENI